jgi:hypothetical protein
VKRGHLNNLGIIAYRNSTIPRGTVPRMLLTSKNPLFRTHTPFSDLIYITTKLGFQLRLT